MNCAMEIIGSVIFVNWSSDGTTDNGQNYIVFDNGVQYTYIPENRGIYKNNVKIAKGVDNCTFAKNIKNGKVVVEVVFIAGNRTRENTYTLKN